MKRIDSLHSEWLSSSLSHLYQLVISFIMVHYFLWIFVIAIFAWSLFSYNPSLFFLWLCYYLYSFFDGSQYKKGRTWDWFRRLTFWRYIQAYNDLTVIREEELDPSVSHIFPLYPHGILILSRIAAYGGIWEELFPNMEFRVLGASPMFFIPGARELCLWMGAVDAGKKTALHCLKNKINLVIYPGGSKEIFETHKESKVTTLVSRLGYARLAIETGSPIVPGFVFGEKWVYDRVLFSKSIQDFFMKQLKVPLLWFYGRGYTWMPYQRKMALVYGKKIDVIQNSSPEEAYVKEIAEKTEMEIRRIFEQYKKQFGYTDDEVLEFIGGDSASYHRKSQ